LTRILVIEDERLIRETIMETLELANLQTIGAANGLMGIHLAREHLPDLIISDITMPDLDGYSVLQDLRSDAETALIPFIFLTARADKSAVRAGMDLGADDYLTKPFTAEELLAAVASRLERQAAIASHHEKKLEDFRGNLVHKLPHELRTPLVSILGFSELILTPGSDLEPGEIVDMVEHINQAAYRLQHLIENFLLHAQIDLMKPEPERLELLRHSYTSHPNFVIADQTRQKAEHYKREVDLTLGLVDDAGVRISEDSLKKIAEELADNAFKFSGVGTPVRVSTTITADAYVLCVSDTGRGMTPQQIIDIGAYVQFERSLHEQQGIGLGLTLTKGLAELYGGTLTIESTLNQGTTVCVQLAVGSSENELT
jgi:two-component system, sensor histidine kinase and response regulator